METRERLATTKQDLVHAARQLRRRPGLFGAAIVTLAVGIGATTAVWSAADHVLFRPLPFADVDRVVVLNEVSRVDGASRDVSPANLLSLVAHATTLAEMGLAEPSGVSVGDVSPPRSVSTWAVSQGFLEALGVTPVVGRLFETAEYTPGGPEGVLLSHDHWRDEHGADPRVLGQTVTLDGQRVLIVGVLPDGMEVPGSKAYWLPKRFRRHELTDRSSGYMAGVARLAPGVTLEEARADLARISATLAEEHPGTNGELELRATPLRDALLGDVRPGILALLGAVGFVLVIACVNVASLLLARGAERERELGVRAALGATRGRLLAQLITESLLLTAIGGAAGVVLAHLGVDLLVALSPPELPRMDAVRVDGPVLLVALGITLLTAFLVGLVPALRFSRPELRSALGGDGRTSTAGRSRTRLRGVLVTAQVALALVLLTGAGLLVRSFVGLVQTDPGFAVDDRVSVQLFLHDGRMGPAERVVRAGQYADRIAAVPGVTGVGIVSALPFHPSRIDAQDAFTIAGRPWPAGAQAPHVYTTAASPGYFEVMEIPLREGRSLDDRDVMGAPKVAVVNETFAERFFPGESPVGHRIETGVMSRPYTWEIVGVAADVLPTALDSRPDPEVFVPVAQIGVGSLTFVAATSVDPASVIPGLRAAVSEVNPARSIHHVATMPELVSETLAAERFNLALFGTFATVALVLTVIGIYGLIRFSVSQRTHEIGVRVAVGAGRGQISSLVVGEALRLSVTGILLGVVAALVLTRFLDSLLVGVAPHDVWTFAAIVVLMTTVSVVAALLPARSAAEVDPMLVLRHE